MTMSHIPDDLGDPRIEHRFLGMDRRIIGPTLAILALVIFWSGVVPAVNEAIEGDPLEPGTVLTVAGVVEFTTVEGWRPSSAPVPSNPQLTLFKDGTTFTVSPGAWDGSADDLLDELEDEFNPVVSGDRAPLALPSGLNGVGFDTTGTDDETGFLAAFASDEPFPDDQPGRGVGIRVQASSDFDISADDQEDVAQMLATMRVLPEDERGETDEDEDE